MLQKVYILVGTCNMSLSAEVAGISHQRSFILVTDTNYPSRWNTGRLCWNICYPFFFTLYSKYHCSSAFIVKNTTDASITGLWRGHSLKTETFSSTHTKRKNQSKSSSIDSIPKVWFTYTINPSHKTLLHILPTSFSSALLLSLGGSSQPSFTQPCPLYLLLSNQLL